MKTRFPKFLFIGAALALLFSLVMAIPTKAQLNSVSIDFAGAEPTTYNPSTGGGSWNNGTLNVDIARSLEGEDFACKDVVSFLTKISIPNSAEIQALGAMTFQLKYSFDMDSKGQSGVALSEPLSAAVNGSEDSASNNDGNSAISLVSTTTTGTKFTSGAKLFATYNLTDVEAGETIVVRINVTLDCQPGSSPTGNLQAKFDTASMIFKLGDVAVNPAESLGSGAKTIDLKNANKIAPEDFLPVIDVTKTASVSSIPETGGSVTFTAVVTNNGVENFILNSLIDDKFGDLNGVGSCAVPQTIAAGAQYSCSFDKTLASDLLISHVNVITASGQDPEGNQTSDSDSETVGFTDVLPDISLTKTANPTAASWTGDNIDYKFRITNNTLESVTVTSLVDDKITLSSQCLALIGVVIAPSAFVECETNDFYLTGIPGGSFINTAAATAQDNELNSDTATASATVNFWWYGRSPGYWKNHPEDWNSGYLPNQFIQDVFTIPSNYLTGSILDIDKNGVKDNLSDGLSYRGGSGLSGGAQIMLRATIAALLNEAYYGADYPGADSTISLIALANSKLATLNRTQLVLLGGYFDFWNNAVHSSMP
jgi:hypothetical protein